MGILEGKVAIVTGASHPLGMGFNAGKKLIEAGAKLVLTGRVTNPASQKELDKRAAELVAIGGEVIAVAADVGECQDSCRIKV